MEEVAIAVDRVQVSVVRVLEPPQISTATDP